MGGGVKQILLDAAEVADAWRIVPRAVMACYGFMVLEAQVWYFALLDPSGAQSAYISVLWGTIPAVLGFYFNTGRKWT